ncbi:oligogalacturonate lyase family protein [Amorphus orientalis]|uniref:Oligogalacturonide lyase n=1 Tax=Amorphus orientalis TaxID=649198 RepID=A0AAE4AS90_9HYPH|nr:oligogalacturonate lyase family protein [Amorphus orientalis]MDQ0314983.1 oligogalacturonide lyase [Amorphus orientalis]
MAWRTWPAEGRTRTDEGGRTLRQVTTHPSIHHHPFFFVDAFDRAMRRLVFVSHRTGRPEIFVEDQESLELIQLTEEEALAEWSVIPSKDGRWIYYVAGQAGYRVSTTTGERECLIRFGAAEMRETGMVGAAMGTTALSASGRWWAVPVRDGAVTRFWMIDTERGSAEVFLEKATIGHPQFCPDDDDLILYAGPMTDRVWVTDRSGRQDRRMHERTHDLQWITHEVWRPGHRSILFVDWPNGVGEIDVATGEVRALTDFPVWHGAPDTSGERLVCDTNFPDIGIHLLDLAEQDRQCARFVCRPESSSMGAHWAGPFPYANGPVKVFAPQHTHPHPRFSPDGRQIVFTSDRSGTAQIYVVSNPEGT